MAKKTKAFIVPLLAILMALTLTACDSKNNDSTVSGGESDGYLYSSERIALPEELISINCVSYDSGYIYMAYTGSQDGVNTKESIAMMELGGSEWTEIPYEPEYEGYSIVDILPDADGSIWILAKDNEYGTGEASIGGDKNYLLEEISETGDMQRAVDLDYLSEDTGDFYYITGLLCDNQGNWYIGCLNTSDFSGFLSVADSTGTELFRLKNDTYIDKIIETGDGKIAAVYSGDDDSVMAEIDTDAKKWGEEFSFGGTYSLINVGSDYSMYLNDGSNLYEYSMETGERTILLNWIKNSINTSNVQYLQVLSDTQILCAMSNELLLLTKNDEVSEDNTDAVEKKVITMGGVLIEEPILSAVIRFNNTNEEYSISITDYWVVNDFYASITNMNTQIMAGSIPDIFVMTNGTYLVNSYSITSDRYIAKGLFEDLYPYIDSDPEIGRDDFVQSALSSLDRDGSLYELVDSFYIKTLAGKTEIVGDKMGWTIEDLYTLFESYPEANYLFGSYYTQSAFLDDFFTFCSDDFIDWTKGECNFESENFIRLLEFAATLPADYSDEGLMTAELIANGRQLLQSSQIMGRDFIQLTKDNFGSEVNFIGFPVSEGVGNALEYFRSFAISSQSQYKDGAWEFIRTLLLEEHQENLIKEGIHYPIMQTYLESSFQEVINNGGEIIHSYDNEVSEYKLTQEDVEQYMELINSISRVARYDDSMMEIIQEEAAAFFAGDKTAQETAAIIQNRMETYVNEQR